MTDNYLKIAGQYYNVKTDNTVIHNLRIELKKAKADAERWQFYCCGQTAWMLGSKLDPNDENIDWYAECNKFADEHIKIDNARNVLSEE